MEQHKKATDDLTVLRKESNKLIASLKKQNCGAVRRLDYLI